MAKTNETVNTLNTNLNSVSTNLGNVSTSLSNISTELQSVKNENAMSMCDATISGNARDFTANTWYTILFDTLSDNDNYSVGSDGVITVKKDGYYIINAKAHFGCSAKSQTVLNLNVNASTKCEAEAQNISSVAQQRYLTASYSTYLTAGSTIYLAIFTNVYIEGGLYGAGADNRITIVKIHS